METEKDNYVHPGKRFTRIGQEVGYGQGMTLRDWFAGQALTAIMAAHPDADCGARGYANDAYLYADAMLEARSKPADGGE